MNCRVIRYSDEMSCASCGLRWDVNDPEPPECRNSFPEADRERLEKVARGYHDLMVLQRQQRETTAKMIRACVARVQLSDSRKRKEGIDGLVQLADMLEKQT